MAFTTVLDFNFTLDSFSTLKGLFQNYFYDSLNCDAEDDTTTFDTVHSAGLMWDYITIVCLDWTGVLSLQSVSRPPKLQSPIPGQLGVLCQ